MKWIILFIFISCGKDIDPRETQLIFNFKKTNELMTNPGRFVLFASTQARLEKARVLVQGNNSPIIFPNGSWKFSVIGFENSVVASSVWNLYSPIFCGSTDFLFLGGNPISVPINVNSQNCNQAGATETVDLSISDAGGTTLLYGYKWIMPQGNRDQDDNETYVGNAFSTNCIKQSTEKVKIVKNLTSSKKIPYFLILKIYADRDCLRYLGQMEFDGDVTTNPQLEIRSDVVRTFNIINIILNNQAAPPIFSTTIQSVQ